MLNDVANRLFSNSKLLEDDSMTIVEDESSRCAGQLVES